MCRRRWRSCESNALSHLDPPTINQSKPIASEYRVFCGQDPRARPDHDRTQFAIKPHGEFSSRPARGAVTREILDYPISFYIVVSSLKHQCKLCRRPARPATSSITCNGLSRIPHTPDVSSRSTLRDARTGNGHDTVALRASSVSQSVSSRPPRAHHTTSPPSQRTAPLPAVNTSTEYSLARATQFRS